MTIKRFRATLARDIQKVRTFQGAPKPGTQQKYELIEDDFARLHPQMVNLALCKNHVVTDTVGTIKASYRDPGTKAWNVEYEIDGATEKGRDAIEKIHNGELSGISLQHLWSVNKAVEASL